MAAGAITGEQRLNIEVRLDTKGLKKGTAEYRAALLKMTKATKKANLAQSKLSGGAEKLRSNNRGASAAIIELGRGASDARFGFHGLGNNLERATELMGSLIKKNGGLKGAFKALGASLLGPAGIVVAITVLIAYGPAIIKFFKNSFGDPAEVAKEKVMELNKELKALRDDYFGIEDTREADILRKWHEIIAAQEEYIRLLKESAKQSAFNTPSAGGVMVANDTRSTYADQQFAELQQNINKVAQNNDKLEIERINREKERLRLFKEGLKYWRERENISKNNIKSGNEQYFKDNETGLGDAFDLGNQNIPKIVDVDSVQVIDEYADGLEELNAILRETGSIFADLSPEISKKLMDIDAAMLTSTQKTQQFAQAIIGGFESAAGQGGNFLEQLAKGLMSSLGSILIQQGTAAIFSGIAKNAIVPGLGADSIKKGALVVAAGVALKAGSNIIGPKSDSGGGGGGASRSTPTATTVTPQSLQENGQGGSLVATVRGQDLRFILQAADNSYGALS